MTEESKEKKASQDLLTEVADAVSRSTPQVRSRVVDALVEKEVKVRADLLEGALAKRSAAFSELKKIDRPDVQTFNADGSPATSHYSKPRLEEIKKAKEALDKVDGAVEKALGGDWSKLKEQK